MKRCLKKWLLTPCLVLFLLPLTSASEFVTLTRRATAKAKLPTNITTITAEEIKQSGADSLGDILDQHPAIDVSRSGSLGSLISVRMRGVPSSNQVQIVIDDQPVGGVSIQSINTGIIPLENIEKIEIVRGGSAGLYGPNVIGGVVHIFTKKQNDDGGHASVGFEGGSHQTKKYRATAGARGNRVDAHVVGNKYSTKGFQDNADAQHQDVAANLGTSFSNGGRVELNYEGIGHKNGTPSGTPVAFNLWDGERERTPNTASNRSETEIHKARLKTVLPVGNGTLFQSQVYHSDEDFLIRPNVVAAPFAHFSNFITGNDTRVILPFGLTAGGSYERDERNSLGQADRHIVNWGLYLQQILNWSKFTVIPAVRFDQHSTTGNEYNPRLTTVFRPTNNWKISANAARSVRSPTLVDLFIVSQTPGFPAFDFFGNPNLKPEVAWTYDLGTEVSVGECLLGITGYFTRIRDRHTNVDTDGNGNVDTIQNTAVAELAGVELVAAAKTGPFKHDGNLTFQRAKGSTATSSRFVPLRLTPKWLANYRLTWNVWNGIRLINHVQYVRRQFQLDGNLGVRLPSYTIWDARLEKNIGVLDVYAAVKNITGKRYAESITFGNPVPQPDRTYWGGISIQLGNKS